MRPGGPSALRVLFCRRAEGRCLCPAAGPLSPRNLLARARAAGLAGGGTRQGTRGPSAQRALFMEGPKGVAFVRPLEPFPCETCWQGCGRPGWRVGEEGARLRGPFPAPTAPRHGGSVASGRGRLGWRAKGTRQRTRGPSALRVLFYGRVEGRCLCPAAGPLSPANLLARARAAGLAGEGGKKRPGCGAYFPHWSRRGIGVASPAGAGGRVGVRGREKGGPAAEPFPAPVAPRLGGVASGRGRLGWRAKGTRQGTRGPSAQRVLFYGRVEGRRLCPAAGPLSPANLLARARAAGMAGEGGKKRPGCGTLPRACRAEARRRCQRARAAGMAGEGNKARGPGTKRPAGPFYGRAEVRRLCPAAGPSSRAGRAGGVGPAGRAPVGPCLFLPADRGEKCETFAPNHSSSLVEGRKWPQYRGLCLHFARCYVTLTTARKSAKACYFTGGFP